MCPGSGIRGSKRPARSLRPQIALIQLVLGNIQVGNGEFMEGLRAEEQAVRGAAASTPEEVLAEVSRTHGVTPN